MIPTLNCSGIPESRITIKKLSKQNNTFKRAIFQLFVFYLVYDTAFTIFYFSNHFKDFFNVERVVEQAVSALVVKLHSLVLLARSLFNFWKCSCKISTNISFNIILGVLKFIIDQYSLVFADLRCLTLFLIFSLYLLKALFISFL